VPTTHQYPLERERDVQRRWKHLLQRTVVPSDVRQRNSSPPFINNGAVYKSSDGRKCAVEYDAKGRSHITDKCVQEPIEEKCDRRNEN
jgi:hypothetical protein